ncbi:MAG: MmgE/PrpD family protein, partial [Deltaproteobacteria bacterium]|nr:MmgE/PrpD family protein [Deltaproteobacteria bacterium]
VLEGKFGFLKAFSDAPLFDALTDRLGRNFETMNTCIKRFACHINAHAPIEALQKLKREHRFAPTDIEQIVVAGIEKLVTHHAIYQPKDLMMAQYSIPFCVALALCDDPREPKAFDERKIRDRKMISLSRLVRLQVDPEIEKKGWDRAARVTVRLKDGSRLSALVIHFKGTPKNPLSPAELEDKVARLTRGLISARGRARLFEAVDSLERLDRVSSLTSLLRGDA